MFERFTDRARKVTQLASQEAQHFNHEHIGTEHILLGLVAEGSGVAANALKNLDTDLRKVRLGVEKIVPPGPGGEPVAMGRLPWTPRAKKVIEYAIEEARGLKHNYVGTEHLLLGLLREREGPAAEVLTDLGLKFEEVREEVQNLLGRNMPLGIPPSRAVVADARPTVLNAPAELTAEQLQLVRERVRHLNEQKDVFVAALDFTLAARCRAEAESLALLLAWYDRSRSVR